MIFNKEMTWRILLSLCALSCFYGYVFFVDDNLMNKFFNFYFKLFSIFFFDVLWLWFLYSNRTKDGNISYRVW